MFDSKATLNVIYYQSVSTTILVLKTESPQTSTKKDLTILKFIILYKVSSIAKLKDITLYFAKSVISYYAEKQYRVVALLCIKKCCFALY